MSKLGWVADGIDRARAAGGVELETYRKPGFVGGIGVRRSEAHAGGSGTWVEAADNADPGPYDARKQ